MTCENYFNRQQRRNAHDLIRQNHLNTLESRLQILEANPNTRHHTSQHLANPQHPSVPQADQSVVSISETPYSLYEGESSFTSQSLGAREAAQSLANPNRPQTGSNLNVAFNSLNGLLQPSQTTRQGDESRSYDPVQIPLALPAELVIALLRRFQGMILSRVSWESPLTCLSRGKAFIPEFISYQ